ncbi:MAG: ribose 5-phosphate isomerase B [Clostridia bacterium]|nr:ribose 5-phosphate isomerase B [Clostridia bacterium]MBQ4157223.1 ribose 5-phosphate isomerase B [Clostridia bacterium]
MKIAFGCDHKGFILKKALIDRMTQLGHEVIDCGTCSEESTHYPIYGEKVGALVSSGECERGVLVCGTGYGISLAANQFKGVRAVNCSDVYTATLTRSHNNANVLSVGAMVVGEGLALLILEAFLNTPFDGGRHQARLDMVREIREKNA